MGLNQTNPVDPTRMDVGSGKVGCMHTLSLLQGIEKLFFEYHQHAKIDEGTRDGKRIWQKGSLLLRYVNFLNACYISG